MKFINANKNFDEALKVLAIKIRELDEESVSLIIYQSLNGYKANSDQIITAQEDTSPLLEFLNLEHKKNSKALSDDEDSLSGESVQRMYILSMPFLSNKEEDSISKYHNESLDDVVLLNVLTIQYKNYLLNIVE
jgi:hypothetical protein|tara:strand:+ start:3596 stop:3997 length:402 start_codon:yes stop_codon:yes gene_type:complete